MDNGDNMRDNLNSYITERDKREAGFAALVEEKLLQRRAARTCGEDTDAAVWEETDLEEQPTTPNAKA